MTFSSKILTSYLCRFFSLISLPKSTSMLSTYDMSTLWKWNCSTCTVISLKFVFVDFLWVTVTSRNNNLWEFNWTGSHGAVHSYSILCILTTRFSHYDFRWIFIFSCFGAEVFFELIHKNHMCAFSFISVQKYGMPKYLCHWQGSIPWSFLKYFISSKECGRHFTLNISIQ